MVIANYPRSRHYPCTKGQKKVKIVAKVVEGLGDICIDGNPEPGKIALGASDKQSGWTFRACADNAEIGTITILYTNRMHAEPVWVRSYKHYEHFCPSKVAARDALYEFLLKTTVDGKAVDIKAAAFEAHVSVPVQYLLDNMTEYLGIIKQFV